MQLKYIRYLHGTPEERFWPKVNKYGRVPTHMPKLGRCWLWMGSRDQIGYGRFWTRTRTTLISMMAHRFALGVTDPTVQVLHRCDNPPCVRPSHLQVGTAMDNVQDMISKGRFARGEKNGRAKLTVDAVRDIRTSSETDAILAMKYGVLSPAINRVRHGHNWKHVT